MYRTRVLLMAMLLMLSSCSTIEGLFGPSDEELAAQDRLKAENSQLESEISSLRNTLAQLKQEIADQQANAAAAEQAAQAVPSDRLWVTVSFRSGYMELTRQAKAALQRLADKFNAKDRDQSIEVRGYTDNEPIGGYPGRHHTPRHPYKSNEDLSQARAENVAKVLVAAGIPADAVKSVGYGATNFVADNGTAEGRAKNRRVEIHLVK